MDFDTVAQEPGRPRLTKNRLTGNTNLVPVKITHRGSNHGVRILHAGSIRAPTVVVMIVVAIGVTIQEVMGIEWLIRVERVANERGDGQRRNVHLGVCLIAIPFGEIVVEQIAAIVLATHAAPHDRAAINLSPIDDAAVDHTPIDDFAAAGSSAARCTVVADDAAAAVSVEAPGTNLSRSRFHSIVQVSYVRSRGPHRVTDHLAGHNELATGLG